MAGHTQKASSRCASGGNARVPGKRHPTAVGWPVSAPVAQSIERSATNGKVGGEIPSGSTSFSCGYIRPPRDFGGPLSSKHGARRSRGAALSRAAPPRVCVAPSPEVTLGRFDPSRGSTSKAPPLHGAKCRRDTCRDDHFESASGGIRRGAGSALGACLVNTNTNRMSDLSAVTPVAPVPVKDRASRPSSKTESGPVSYPASKADSVFFRLQRTDSGARVS